MVDLGNGIPSALMDKMISMLDGHQPCMLCKQLFLNRMPDSICPRLADADFIDSSSLAEWAYELWLFVGKILGIL